MNLKLCVKVTKPSGLMAMLVEVDHSSAPPAKKEISKSSAKDDGKTKPNVVGHEDKHETVRDEDLNHV